MSYDIFCVLLFQVGRGRTYYVPTYILYLYSYLCRALAGVCIDPQPPKICILGICVLNPDKRETGNRNGNGKGNEKKPNKESHYSYKA